ncbi:Ribosomal_L2 domain-containing protein [Cephalotus follicularis]|uniref:60S ribosomal protein L2, mitochondrial n=1 Tax=Cephalotus follicularis TaxID=3775 RepID=A0A1Q3BXP9_CEPFO|nr:Ribosomal_L2 domain-containing protein [Cephalotus follicularis]
MANRLFPIVNRVLGPSKPTQGILLAHTSAKLNSGKEYRGTPVKLNDNIDVKKKALRQFTLAKGKSAGRNSSGRITIFHRGGGAKRSQRIIDLKRSTSSMGIVERIEYDPNRSSRIALVRWIDGVKQQQKKFNKIEEFSPPNKILEPTSTTIRGLYSFSSLASKVDHRKLGCFSSGSRATNVVVGLPIGISPLNIEGAESKITCTKEVFLSAFSSPKAKGRTASLSSGTSFGFPRIAVAGAKPNFFAPRIREELGGKDTFSLSDVQKWRKHSIIWAHRIKRKAAVSWQSFSQQDTFGFIGAAEHNKMKPKADQGNLHFKPMGQGLKDAACNKDCVPVTYIIASHQLEAGKMVMNS